MSTATLMREPQSTNGGSDLTAISLPKTLTAEEMRLTNTYWRAANYLSVGQIYLYDNPLLKEPLTLAHVKPLVTKRAWCCKAPICAAPFMRSTRFPRNSWASSRCGSGHRSRPCRSAPS